MSSTLYILLQFKYPLYIICDIFADVLLSLPCRTRGTLLRAGHASIRRSGCLQKKDAGRRLFPRGARGPI